MAPQRNRGQLPGTSPPRHPRGQSLHRDFERKCRGDRSSLRSHSRRGQKGGNNHRTPPGARQPLR
eukprot:8414163-Pyramimonas_sp.AAC.1